MEYHFNDHIWVSLTWDIVLRVWEFFVLAIDNNIVNIVKSKYKMNYCFRVPTSWELNVARSIEQLSFAQVNSINLSVSK